MDKSFLQQSIHFFASFDMGEVKSRSMFGGFGIFCNDVMFALIVEDKLHLRASNQNECEFKALDMKPYCYTKRGFPVVTKYYEVPVTWWQDKALLLQQGKKAFEIAQAENNAKKAAEPSRIKDLPNLRLSTERLLKRAGIDSVEELQNQGALAAFKALRATHGKSVSIDLLWSLEGALTNTHWTVIPPQRRNELLNELNSTNSRNLHL